MGMFQALGFSLILQKTSYLPPHPSIPFSSLLFFSRQRFYLSLPRQGKSRSCPSNKQQFCLLGLHPYPFSDVELQGKAGGSTMCLPTAEPWKLRWEHNKTRTPSSSPAADARDPAGRGRIWLLAPPPARDPAGEGAELATGSSSRRAHFPLTF